MAERGESGKFIDAPALRQAVIEAVEEGVSITSACALIGVNRQIIFDWIFCAEHGYWKGSRVLDGSPCTPSAAHLEIIRDFVEQLTLARARLEARLVKRLVDAGQRANANTNMLDWRPNAWLLNNHPAYRETWHPKLNTPNLIITPAVTHPDLGELSEAQLIDLAGGEWREILTPRQLPAPPPEGPHDGPA